MVGHLERFNPAVQATIPLITKPMFFEVHRLSVFTPRSLDLDVVLDLMIHDLDAVLWFVKSPIKEIRAAGIPILSDKIDIANARIEFESGCIANFTASGSQRNVCESYDFSSHGNTYQSTTDVRMCWSSPWMLTEEPRRLIRTSRCSSRRSRPTSRCELNFGLSCRRSVTGRFPP